MAEELPGIQPGNDARLDVDAVLGNGVEHEICSYVLPWWNRNGGSHGRGSSPCYCLVRICL